MFLYGVLDLQWLGRPKVYLKKINMTTGTHQLNGLFHFSSAQVYRCKNPGDPLMKIFSRGFYLSISKYIFPIAGGKFAVTFIGVKDWNLFSAIIVFQGIELCKIKFQGFRSQTIIYFRVYCFLKIWMSIPLYG